MKIQLHPDDRNKIREIVSVLENGKSFLLTTHRNIDGDAIGSELALYGMLKGMGKKVSIINNDAIPVIYRFLPNAGKVRVDNGNAGGGIKYDVSIVLDCGSADRTGRVFELVKKSGIVVNVDHHFSNPAFGDINWINSGFSATGEMVYFILTFAGRKITVEEAECLYTAILTDTGNFVHNIGRHTMDVMRDLVAAGAKPEHIVKKIYFERPLKSIKLLSLCLNNLRFDRRNKICWMKVDREMFRVTGTKEEDTNGFIDILVKIKEADVVFLLKESEGIVKASLRSRKNFDVDNIAAKFGGGGHKQAAGCYFEDIALEDAEEKLLAAIRADSSNPSLSPRGRATKGEGAGR